jgi:RNA polymerase sigma-70 factor (ECF subfamily)
MVPADPAATGISPPPGLDPDSEQWVRALAATGAEREAALAGLHELLVRVARGELRRRGPGLGITRKLEQFRGESRFTTWACKFVIFEVSAKAGRHFWRNGAVSLDAADWDRLPDRLGAGPASEAERHDLVAAVRSAVDEELTARQREVFVALVLQGVPLEALAIQLGSNRNAIYKAMFDARRKLRAVLTARGYLDEETAGPS